jgi:ABC-2 type transport system permease protein
VQAVRLYAHYTLASIRAQLQYPGAFLMMALAQFAGTVVEIVGIWALFQRFDRIAGWSFGEVCVFYGVVNLAFSVADTVTRGFDVFGTEFVRTGNFDRLLLRPRTTAFQLMGYEFRLTRIGRFAQGLWVLLVGIQATQLAVTPQALAILLAAIAGGAALFSGLFILQATLAFWTVESLEVANILTYGGVQAGQYPMAAYGAWFRDFLTFVVPIGCVAYLPVVAVLGRSDPLGAPDWLLPASPMAGFVFLAVSLWVWGFGVRRYTSTGS